MPLNVSKGNMYAFVSHTWNTVKGKCPHDCSYCFMKQFKQATMRFDKKELATDLGEGNFIFVGSSCDMWADEVPEDWILETLSHCREHDNMYLFQSKNPERFYMAERLFPKKTHLGTTIETNRTYPEMGKASEPEHRMIALNQLSHTFPTMVTVEPIMDFDIDYLHHLVSMCKPEWVNVGADSKGHDLPEPTAMKILSLIGRLEKENIEIKQKDNLKRLMKCL